MKKLFLLLMIMCLALCGCSKEEPQTAPTTPTSEPTKEATPTESVAPTMTDDELLKEIYDEIDDTHKSITKTNYETMVSATNISLTYESVLKELSNSGDGFIKMGPEGIEFDNIGPEMQKALENILGSLSDMKFYQECTIKVSSNGVVSQEQKPGEVAEVTPTSNPEQEELYIKYVKSELDKTSYKNDYIVEKTGYVITIKICQDGFADKINSLHDSNNKDEYESIKSEFGKLAKDFDNKVFDYEIGYCHTAFYLIDDTNTEQYLIAWVDGEFHSEKLNFEA